MGADRFTERAAHELRATGERVRMPKVFNKLDIKSRNQLHGVLASHRQAEMDKDPRCR
jgi:hypothetical protein